MLSLPEKCPYTEFFSGPNTGRYEPEKTPYLDTFHALSSIWRSDSMQSMITLVLGNVS